MIRQAISITLAILLVFAFYVFVAVSANAQEHPSANQYRRTLTREAQYHWGLNAPIAVFAAQIQQESGWREKICSPFACGLTQFTPSTEQWIRGAFPEYLKGGNRLNPAWAIRAMVIYDKHIYGLSGVREARTPCDRWAFTLSSYNGGYGWLARDQAVCSRKPGCDRLRWFGHVADSPSRRRAPQFIEENRGYPRKILTGQKRYLHWGRGVTCSAVR